MLSCIPSFNSLPAFHYHMHRNALWAKVFGILFLFFTIFSEIINSTKLPLWRFCSCTPLKMLRRSGNRLGTRGSPTKSEGLPVSDRCPSVITPNHSTSPNSDIQFAVSNINGVCATQPYASPINNKVPCTVSPVNNHCQTSTPEPIRRVLGLIENELLRYPCDPGHVGGLPVHGRSTCIQVAASDCKRVCCQYFSLR